MEQLRLQLYEALKTLSAHSVAGSLICSAVSDGQLSGTMDIRRICSLFHTLSEGLTTRIRLRLELLQIHHLLRLPA